MKRFVNLLPEEEKVFVRKEYKLRRVVVSFSLILVILVICVMMLLPAYIASVSRLQTPTEKLKELNEKASVVDFAEMEKVISETKSMINLVNLEQQTAPIHFFAEEIISAQTPSIKIRYFSFTRNEEEKSLKILINGTALTRESLVDFSQKLKEKSVFEEVDVPVSNFAKDRDIDFSITIKGKTNL